MSYYTNIIFKSRKVIFNEEDNGYHKVRALEDIKEGEILLMEQLAAHQTAGKVIAYVKNNKELFKSLYPRTKEYSYEDVKEQEMKILAKEKVERNVFAVNTKDGAYYAIGLYISKFNHSDTPNTDNIIHTITSKDNKQLTLASVKTNKGIKKGEELFIDYCNGAKFEGRDIIVDNKNYIAPLKTPLTLTKMEQKIAYKYMDKPAFETIDKNLSLADRQLIYKYDEDVLIYDANTNY